MKFCLTLVLTGISLFLTTGNKCYSQEQKTLPTKESLFGILQKVADWQIEHFEYSKTGSSGHLHDYGIDAWTNATLYMGISEWAKISENDTVYYDWLYNIGKDNDWKIPSNFKEYPQYGLYHADELCIAQFYLDMFDVYKEPVMIVGVKERIDYILNNPPDSSMFYKNKQVLTWSDALFMAPPVYARLSILLNDDRYLTFMDRQFKNTYEHLYDKEQKLFFRDDSYLDKREENGQKIFWGRGNGWVAAGLVNILKVLPEDSSYKPFYENLFSDFIPRLATLQDEHGFWHASLLDPDSYPSPETSATALITYSLAYGINNGLLDCETYYPVLIKSWNALISAVDEQGKLGWVQPIGADPKKVTKDMTAVYGVGAFLMAGAEISKVDR